MFKGATFGTQFKGAHAYREPDSYPSETSHDVTTDSDASIRQISPPVSSRASGPARTSQTYKGAAKNYSAWNNGEHTPSKTRGSPRQSQSSRPDEARNLSNNVKQAKHWNKIDKTNAQSTWSKTSQFDAPGTHERNLKTQEDFIRRPQTANWMTGTKTSQEPIGHCLFIFTTEKVYWQNHRSQDKSRQTENHWKNFSTDNSSRSAPATFTTPPVDYKQPKDAMEPCTIQKMVNFKWTRNPDN